MNELLAKLAVTVIVVLFTPVILLASGIVVTGAVLQSIWRTWR